MAKLILDKVLKKKKLSKRKFAKLMGVDYTNVFPYFRKGYDPHFSMLLRWAKALKCRIRDLIEESQK